MTTWTKSRRQNPGAAIDVDDNVRSQRTAHLEKQDRERRLREAEERVEAAKQALVAFDRTPLEAQLTHATELLKQIENEMQHA